MSISVYHGLDPRGKAVLGADAENMACPNVLVMVLRDVWLLIVTRTGGRRPAASASSTISSRPAIPAAVLPVATKWYGRSFGSSHGQQVEETSQVRVRRGGADDGRVPRDKPRRR